jgi:CHASE2 domain-containing sensor protein
MSPTKSGLILGFAALAFLVFGSLVFFEFIRPFRNGEIDNPLAVTAAVVSVILSSAALSFRKGAAWLNAIVLVLGLTALAAVALIIQALSHMRLF